ncbi:MAG: 4Fe-4S binding protein [Prevotellaceae bacterium]|jgi:NAD-dependent dihydropyrimidine dehydrogenase PreA subunit|nr:4Fe-4S binding protein [Prevotellaceae bacterium]
MKRTIVKIDESRCTGCGACVQGCHGGALQIIDGKARITNEDYCDGLGMCIDECLVGAITLEERESKPEISLPKEPCGCPSMLEMFLEKPTEQNTAHFQLRHFPIQLHLINPNAEFLKNTDFVLAADCTAFAYGNFHQQFLKNKSIAIACPKLDNAPGVYVEKLTAMIDNSSINTLSVIIMEVPCCRGLLQIAQQAQTNAKRKIPIKKIVIGIKGNLQSEEWI